MLDQLEQQEKITVLELVEPHGDVGHFVDTLCASIVAVILADPC